MTEYMDCGCPVPDAGQQDQAEQDWDDLTQEQKVARLMELDKDDLVLMYLDALEGKK